MRSAAREDNLLLQQCSHMHPKGLLLTQLQKDIFCKLPRGASLTKRSVGVHRESKRNAIMHSGSDCAREHLSVAAPPFSTYFLKRYADGLSNLFLRTVPFGMIRDPFKNYLRVARDSFSRTR